MELQRLGLRNKWLESQLPEAIAEAKLLKDI